MQRGSDRFKGAALRLVTVSFKMQKSADGIVAQRHSESYGHGEGQNPCKEESGISRFTPVMSYD
jgi:hypothetical protein